MIAFLFGLLSLILGYTTFNLLKKNEQYEEELEQIYTRVSVVLHTMRSIDERQMFETDDEVGSIFQQLNEILNTLRSIIYGNINDKKEEN